MNKMTKIALGIMILTLLININLYIFRPLGENFYIISDWVLVVCAFAAMVLGFYAFKFHGFKSIQGKALFFLSLGSLFWFLGEFSWAFLEVVMGIEVPFPSIGDLFWYIGYPLFFVGLYYIWKTIGTKIKCNMKCLSILVLMLILIAVSIYGCYPTFIDVEMTLFEKTLSIGYVALDLILVVSGLFILLTFSKGNLLKPWFFIILSLIVCTFADISFTLAGSLYETGGLLDFLWNFDYILLAFGFFYYRQIITEAIKDGKHLKKRD